MVFDNHYCSCFNKELMIMKGVYGITLRARNGREQRTLAWLPTEATRLEFYKKARKNGLEIIINDNENKANGNLHNV